MPQSVPPQSPGVYPGGGRASLLRANTQQYLWQNQLFVAGQASIAVQFERIKALYYPFGVSLQYWFTDAAGANTPTNPGAFEIDFQTSDLDNGLTQYVAIDKITGGLNTSYVGRLELPSFWAKFGNIALISAANAVNFSCLITR
jgi:hypothetical protein